MSEIQFARSAGTAQTLDKMARTVEAVALSGLAPCVRPGPDPTGQRNAWIEELVAGGADLASLNGSPALQDHVPTTRSAVGTVEGAIVQGDKIVCRVRFDGSAEADTVINKVESGSVRGVSLGYKVINWQKAGVRNGLPVFRAVAWKPFELSFCPLPVDPGATVRSQGDIMDTVINAPTDIGAVVNDRAAINATIRSISELAGLDQAWSNAQIDAGRSADEARADAFVAMSKRSRPVVNTTAPVVSLGHSFDDPSVKRRAMSDALAAQLAPGHCKVEGQAINYRGHRVLDLACELLADRGDKINRFDREQILSRSIGSHSSSDFPLLLADAANKSLLAQYVAAQPSYRQIASAKTFNDFKSQKYLRLGDFPAYSEVTEGGNTNYGTISENKESVTAKEFSTGIVIGRKALLNDDLSALSDFSGLIAVRTAAFENASVYALLASVGPTMSDGHALFSTQHSNYVSSGTTIANGIDAAVLAFRSQTSLDGIKINVQPKYLVCGPEQEAAARRMLASINPTQASNANPWSGQFTLIVDADIVGKRWFLAADPAQIPSLVYGYVNGAAGPQIFTETDFDTRSVKIRAGLDFGCGAIDWRGFYLNAGA